MLVPEAYEKLLSECDMDEIKDNLVLWNKLKGISRSKLVGLPSLAHPDRHKAKVIETDNKNNNNSDDLVGITATDAVTRLQKLTNVTQFESK